MVHFVKGLRHVQEDKAYLSGVVQAIVYVITKVYQLIDGTVFLLEAWISFGQNSILLEEGV